MKTFACTEQACSRSYGIIRKSCRPNAHAKHDMWSLVMMVLGHTTVLGHACYKGACHVSCIHNDAQAHELSKRLTDLAETPHNNPSCMQILQALTHINSPLDDHAHWQLLPIAYKHKHMVVWEVDIAFSSHAFNWDKEFCENDIFIGNATHKLMSMLTTHSHTCTWPDMVLISLAKLSGYSFITKHACSLKLDTPWMRQMWWLSALVHRRICTRSSNAALSTWFCKSTVFSATCSHLPGIQMQHTSNNTHTLLTLRRLSQFRLELSEIIKIPVVWCQCSIANQGKFVQDVERQPKRTDLYRLTVVCPFICARICLCTTAADTQWSASHQLHGVNEQGCHRQGPRKELPCVVLYSLILSCVVCT